MRTKQWIIFLDEPTCLVKILVAKKKEKLENIHAFVHLNSICHIHFCLISGVTPEL
jgi:hypothetical protein